MPLEVEHRLSLLPKMSKAQLFALWKQLFRGSPPHQVRRNLLVGLLAYRMQEQTYGGLGPATRKRLRELARKFAVNPDAEISGMQRIKPGTRLVREWHGHSHQVTTLENGYEYAGHCYSSLSEIARLITGTRWSGPLFFGLKRNQARKHINANRS
jgi:hypothetical protein